MSGHSSAHSAAFLQLPAQTNVRVKADAAFPTIASLVQDMESRRDTAESLAAARILELELKLLQSENDMIKASLQAAVGRILGQSAPK